MVLQHLTLSCFSAGIETSALGSRAALESARWRPEANQSTIGKPGDLVLAFPNPSPVKH